MAEPYTKADQLARGPKRPARVKATREEWARLREQKNGLCACVWLGDCDGKRELHHLVPRSQLGDDVAENLIELCAWHHRCVTERHERALREVATQLSDSQYAYIIDKLGEGALERLFGVSG